MKFPPVWVKVPFDRPVVFAVLVPMERAATRLDTVPREVVDEPRETLPVLVVAAKFALPMRMLPPPLTVKFPPVPKVSCEVDAVLVSIPIFTVFPVTPLTVKFALLPNVTTPTAPIPLPMLRVVVSIKGFVPVSVRVPVFRPAVPEETCPTLSPVK